MNYNINSGYGQQLIAAAYNACQTLGKIFIVCPNTDGNYDKLTGIVKADPDGILRLYTTLKGAYDACTSNNNDVILLAGYGTHVITTPWEWSKNRIHVVGLDGGSRLTDQGSKIENTGYAGALAYVLKVTGTRNHFKNIKFLQNAAVATALNVVQMGGEGDIYENCSFIFSVNTNYGLTTASEVVCGEDSGTFINCEFGADTLLTTNARAVFLIKKVTTGQEFKSNRFRDCIWKISSSSSTALLMKVNSTDDVLFSSLFERPVFVASVDSAGGAALGNAVASAAGLVKGGLQLSFPASFNCTKLCAGVTDGVQVSGIAATTAASGVAATPA